MKIATFNIDGIDARLKTFLPWLASAAPDVVCLQDLKTDADGFPLKDVEALGYRVQCAGLEATDSVAILARDAAPVVIKSHLPGVNPAAQTGYLEAAVNGVLFASVFLPGGPVSPDPRFNREMAWLKTLNNRVAQLMASKVPAVLACTFNPAPADDGTDWTETLMANLQSQAAFAALLDQGWTDAIGAVHPGALSPSYWPRLDGKFSKKGFRLDYLLLSPDLAAQLVDAGVDQWLPSQEGASPHAPCWITLDV